MIWLNVVRLFVAFYLPISVLKEIFIAMQDHIIRKVYPPQGEFSVLFN